MMWMYFVNANGELRPFGPALVLFALLVAATLNAPAQALANDRPGLRFEQGDHRTQVSRDLENAFLLSLRQEFLITRKFSSGSDVTVRYTFTGLKPVEQTPAFVRGFRKSVGVDVKAAVSFERPNGEVLFTINTSFRRGRGLFKADFSNFIERRIRRATARVGRFAEDRLAEVAAPHAK